MSSGESSELGTKAMAARLRELATALENVPAKDETRVERALGGGVAHLHLTARIALGLGLDTHPRLLNLPVDEEIKRVAAVAFLGLCDRAEVVHPWGIPELNILGLKSQLTLPIFPAPLVGSRMVVGIFNLVGLPPDIRLRLLAPDGSTVTDMGLTVAVSEVGTPPDLANVGSDTAPGAFAILDADTLSWADMPTWSVTALDLPLSAFAPKPGRYIVALVRGDRLTPIGGFECAWSGPAGELTADRIAGIRSNPFASQTVHMNFHCRACDFRLRTYASLSREPATEGPSNVWYRDLPDRVVCTCGVINQDVTLMRLNLHALLGGRRAAVLNVGRLYQEHALDELSARFRRLLDATPPEEEIQRFLTENPVVLAPFSPVRLFPKARVLTECVTDFAIVSPRKELILIEIERADKVLLTQSGQISAELQQAINQADEWLHLADEERSAVLRSIGGLSMPEVGVITAVVIAGRDAGYSPDALRRLKKGPLRRVRILTYDDLAGSLEAFADALRASPMPDVSDGRPVEGA